MAKNHVIHVYMEEQTKEWYEQEARELGLDVSAYARLVLRKNKRQEEERRNAEREE